METAIDIAIGKRLGYGWISDRDGLALIKRADQQALLAEAELLLPDRGAGIRESLEADGVDLDGLAPLPWIVGRLNAGGGGSVPSGPCARTRLMEEPGPAQALGATQGELWVCL